METKKHINELLEDSGEVSILGLFQTDNKNTKTTCYRSSVDHENYLKRLQKNPNYNHERYLRNKEKHNKLTQRWNKSHPNAQRVYSQRCIEKHREMIAREIVAKRDEKNFFRIMAVVSVITKTDNRLTTQQ